MKDIFKYFWGLCLSLLLFTGCYREDVAYIHNHIDNLDLKTITDQIEAMKDGIAEMQALQEQITPIVKALQDAKDGIAKDIAALQSRIEAEGTASTELQAQLISLQSQYKTLDAAYKILSESNLQERTEELEALVSTSDSGFKDRVTSLETAAQAFASAQALAELKAVVDVLPDLFAGLFDDALSRCEDSVIQWISDSQAFMDLFENFYNVAEMETLLEVLRDVDAARAQELSELKKSAEKTDKEIRDMVEDAVNGTTKKLGERMDAVDADLKVLSDRVDGLLARVEALEKLYDVVGDYSSYKSNLISDILRLQAVVGENGTLISLANTLKLVLSQSEQSYYDLGKIVNDIAALSGGISAQEEKLKSYEELVSSLAAIEQFTAIREKFTALTSVIDDLKAHSDTNILDLQTLAELVDDIVDKWTDDTLYQIYTNTEDIVKLKEEAARLRLALEQAVKDGKDRNDANHKEVIDLIAKVNESLVALKVEDFILKVGSAQTAVDSINSLLENCGVGEIKGLQNILSNLDSSLKDIDARLQAIWSLIGTEVLSIEGSLINAINVLNSRFGGVEGIAGMTSSLQNNLDLIKNVLAGIIGDDAQGQSLTSLRILLEDLSGVISGKADKSALPAIETDIAGIQKALVDYAIELDTKLADYIKSTDAAQVYATTALLGTLIDAYNTYVGDFESAFADQTGTVIVAVAALENRIGELESSISELVGKIEKNEGDINDANAIIGAGSIGEWATDLTVAVNYLYSLVGDESVSAQASAIAQEQVTIIVEGMISTLVNAILGEEGDASDIKDILDGFTESFSDFGGSLDDLYESVGDISGLKDAQNPDIAAMIRNIRAELATLSGMFAELGHGHSIADVTGLQNALDTLSNNLSAVSVKFGLLDEYVKGAFENSINALAAKFDGYTTPDDVNDLIAAAENILASALMSGEGFNGYFADLNLSALQAAIQAILNTDINDIIKENGTIDSKAKALIGAAIAELNLDGLYKVADLDLSAYAKIADVETSIEVLTAFAALSIELETGNTYSYTDFGTAVKHIYDLLQNHISDYGASQNSFNELKARVDAIEPMIGEGFSSSNTVADVLNGITGTIEGIQGTIEELEDLFGDLGTGNTVKSLVDKLQGLYDALVAALIGDGTIDSDHSLTSFKDRLDAIQTGLDAIGFDTIKNSEDKSLAEVISDIDDKIDGIWAIIGDGYDKDNSLADAISGLNDALNGLVTTEDFEGRTDTLSEKLASLLAALGGETALTSLSDVSGTLDDIKERLDKFNESDVSVEDALSAINNSIDVLFDIVGTIGLDSENDLVSKLIAFQNVVDNFKLIEEDTEFLDKLALEMADITLDIIVEGKVRTGLYDNSIVRPILEGIQFLMTLADILSADEFAKRLANWIQQLAPYATSQGDLGKLNLGELEANSLVDAINKLYDLIGSTDPENQVTQEDLDKLRAEIIGEGSSYQSLKALGEVFDRLAALVGTPSGSTVYGALAALEDLLGNLEAMFGINETDYTSVWSAISDLSTAILGKLYKVNSLVFIPDYEDGKATYSRSAGVTMKFKVNASPAFFDRFDDDKILVKGYLKTRAVGKGTSINGTSVSLDGDVLSVTFAANQFSGMTLENGYTQIAVSLVDSGAEVFVSEYVSLYITSRW